MCIDERRFQPLVMTQSPSTSIPTTFPSSSSLRSAWFTFLSGFELSLVLLITTFLKLPALSATLILRVCASRGVVVLLMANSTKPGKTLLYSQCIKSNNSVVTWHKTWLCTPQPIKTARFNKNINLIYYDIFPWMYCLTISAVRRIHFHPFRVVQIVNKADHYCFYQTKSLERERKSMLFGIS